jgi:Protein RETICULATA-related
MVAMLLTITKHTQGFRVSSAAIQKALSGVPSAVFERSIPGVIKYKLGSRIACIGVKFLEYSLAGMTCGLIGQGIANGAMMARRAQNPDAEYTVDPPPLLKTALVWGLFMGVSSNLRYQAVFGLERLVDMTIAKQIPAVRFFN